MSSPTKTVVIKPYQVTASGLALSSEVLATANQIARSQGHPAPFAVRRIKTSEISGETQKPDLVILPGLGLASKKEITDAFEKTEFKDLIRAVALLCGPTTVVAASCSGVFALGKAGLINRKRVTTTWWLAPLLQSVFPETRLSAGEIVVEDGTLITAGAALAHIDLMLHITERFAGLAIAEECRRFLIVDDRRSQTPYMSVATLIASDPALRQGELFVRQNIQNPIETGAIAAACGLGARTFSRRLKKVAGMTPTQFLQTIRVTKAIRLAKTTRLANDEIAVRVGYSDATSLRRVVRKHTGQTLEALRG